MRSPRAWRDRMEDLVGIAEGHAPDEQSTPDRGLYEIAAHRGRVTRRLAGENPHVPLWRTRQ